MKPSTRFEILLAGVSLVLAGAWLAKPPKPRPLYWRAAMWGIACSVCVLLAFAFGIVIVHIPDGQTPPGWLKNILALAVIIGLFSAIICITHGIIALVKSRADKRVEAPAA